jgi:hypothetical protein
MSASHSHPHGHQHGEHHGHHEHKGESNNLVLDIGGDVGALLIYAGPELREQEIEISPGHDPAAPRSHNVVHARTDGRRTGYTAVFPSVPAGDYTIWRHDGGPQASVTIQGGRVTEHHWN